MFFGGEGARDGKRRSSMLLMSGRKEEEGEGEEGRGEIPPPRKGLLRRIVRRAINTGQGIGQQVIDPLFLIGYRSSTVKGLFMIHR